MLLPSDKVIAQRLLHLRAHGDTYAYFVQLYWKIYLLPWGFFAFFSMGLLQAGHLLIAAALGGALFGRCFGEFRDFQVSRRLLPMTLRVTDWSKVEQIAMEDER